jgi:energy-converting hydrogenase Eha subunit A
MDKVRLQGSIKAGIALVVAILAALTTAVTGKTDFGDIDTKTWLIALGAVLASGALTAFVTNVVGVFGGVIKAVIGAFGAAITALITAYDDNVISPEEKLTALSAFVIGLSLIYQIPDPTPPETIVQPVHDVGRTGTVPTP